MPRRPSTHMPRPLFVVFEKTASGAPDSSRGGSRSSNQAHSQLSRRSYAVDRSEHRWFVSAGSHRRRRRRRNWHRRVYEGGCYHRYVSLETSVLLARVYRAVYRVVNSCVLPLPGLSVRRNASTPGGGERLLLCKLHRMNTAQASGARSNRRDAMTLRAVELEPTSLEEYPDFSIVKMSSHGLAKFELNVSNSSSTLLVVRRLRNAKHLDIAVCVPFTMVMIDIC